MGEKFEQILDEYFSSLIDPETQQRLLISQLQQRNPGISQEELTIALQLQHQFPNVPIEDIITKSDEINHARQNPQSEPSSIVNISSKLGSGISNFIKGTSNAVRSAGSGSRRPSNANILNPINVPRVIQGTGMDYITNFILDKEGAHGSGLIPMDRRGNVLGQSGVTVAGGLDLGQHTVQGLIAMGHSPEIVQQWANAGFIGAKRGDAVAALNRARQAGNIPQLNPDQIRAINNITINQYTNTARRNIGEEHWEKLNDSQRAAVTSMAYHRGHVNANVIKHIQTGNYGAAADWWQHENRRDGGSMNHRGYAGFENRARQEGSALRGG